MTFLDNNQLRKYTKEECVCFRKTKEKFGGLSNMAPGFPILIEDNVFFTSEALYQCCRFPNYPHIQAEIMRQHSPMIAKDISRKNIRFTRDDWEYERIKIMRWCLYAKLICNWHSFGKLLDSTDNKAIVEDSYKDNFWGATWDGSYYVGVNALGRLLMQTRETYRCFQKKDKILLPPPNITNFTLLGKSVDKIYVDITTQPEALSIF